MDLGTLGFISSYPGYLETMREHVNQTGLFWTVGTRFVYLLGSGF